MAKAQDLSGLQFGRLTVLERHYDDKPNTRWRCICECGNETIAITGNLKNGRHKSCGCYRGGATAHNRVDKVMTNGYVLVWKPDHPRANKNSGRVREHIIVMEEQLGRYLVQGEEVHHINAIKHDNRPENLELWTRSHPAGARVEDHIKWAEATLKLYAPEKLK